MAAQEQKVMQAKREAPKPPTKAEQKAIIVAKQNIDAEQKAAQAATDAIEHIKQ